MLEFITDILQILNNYISFNRCFGLWKNDIAKLFRFNTTN